MTRTRLLALCVIGGIALSGCTTTEGTNAFADIGTFERDVAIETLRGMGMVDRDKKPEPGNPRGPLVLPKEGAVMPPPDSARREVAQLPADSDKVQVNTAGLTEADLMRLRNARVIDLSTTTGRPLTEAETAQLTAKMADVRVKNSARPLYMPPVEYYTTVKGQDMVCLAANGELVPLNDKSCPPEVRKALSAQVQ